MDLARFFPITIYCVSVYQPSATRYPLITSPHPPPHPSPHPPQHHLASNDCLSNMIPFVSASDSFLLSQQHRYLTFSVVLCFFSLDLFFCLRIFVFLATVDLPSQRRTRIDIFIRLTALQKVVCCEKVYFYYTQHKLR